MERKRIDLESIRSRLASVRGRDYWRGLEELAESEEFRELLRREFPTQVSGWIDGLSRREFLKFAGASLALAGLGACGSPAPTNEKIVPYVRQPEEIVPGRPLFFATAMPLGGFGRGVLVESHMGRPTKVEGNPDHPASLGGADVFMQASILDLYDPDRSQVISNGGMISTWHGFFSAINAELEAQRLTRGKGLRLLTETVTSPTLAHQIEEFLAKFPSAKWHQYEPDGRNGARAGSRLAFGENVETVYRYDKADVILSLDSDFLYRGPGSLRYAREFVDRRRVGPAQTRMNRLYLVESTPTLTGSMADHRLSLQPGQIVEFALAVAEALGMRGIPPRPGPAPFQENWIRALARDLRSHRGSGIVVAGDHQPPLVHALAHVMNAALDNVGRTVVYTEPAEARPVDQVESLRELARDMESGQVDLLIIIGGNPVYTAPADLRFADRLSRVSLRAHLSLYDDETSALCHWHIPQAHYLESWSDVRAFDGTASIIQPLIAPLYGGKGAHEFLAAIIGQPGRSDFEIVREYWKRRVGGDDFERFWNQALHDGFIADSALPPKSVKLKPLPEWMPRQAPARPAEGSLQILFRPDPTILDGQFANNGWLQELPKPLTKLTWDNAALLSPATAERLGLSYQVGITGGEHGRVHADLVEISYRGRTVRAPAWILPGQADDCVVLHLGYGRTRAGKVGTGAGFSAYALRTSEAMWHDTGAKVRKVGAQQPLACTQFHYLMEGRRLLRVGTIDEFRENPNFVEEKAIDGEPGGAPSLYPGFRYEGYAWGMSIDVNACIGCNACVVACQAENNSPVVGKEQVMRGREMHWIRIDRYYKGDLENPEIYHQPVPCMHCENAPCELVCPVGATVHSSEGLNDMVYNRCVGTRYCSNNCPYKVRRFNFLQFADFETPSFKLLHNPDVTVRSRGVMEKCTYCVQRINAAKIEAEKEDRKVRDGEIQTACQQSCPTQAIVFGNINDAGSRVSKLKADPRNYRLLAELNTRPRTSYLARLRNPNPEIESE